MIVGIYNFKPDEGCYLADFMRNKRFILDTDKYAAWCAGEYASEGGVPQWDKVLVKLIKMLLERRGYGKSGFTFEWSVLGWQDGKYVNNMGQPFGDAVPIENMTSQEQMDMIYKNIAPVILSMSEAYPNSTAHPVFKFDCHPETQEIKVTLSELNFKIGN